MRRFFRVATKTTTAANVVSNRSRLRGALIVALAGLVCVGCVGRKQYAINEAILISERRQLEDEIYRLQFELRDALEENERLRQELGGDEAGANSPATRTRARAGANDAFFPGLDASQTSLGTTGGGQKIQTPPEPRSADAAPATGEAVETLPDYVPIPVTSTRPSAARTQSAPLAQNAQAARSSRSSQTLQTAQIAQVAQTASTVRNGKTRPAGHYASTSTAKPNGGKTLGVRRVVPVAGSTADGGEVVAPVYLDAPSTEASSANADAWSPLAR